MANSEDPVDLLPLLDELRAMAQTGLHYADDPYDEDRYERILDLVAEHYGHTFELPPAEIRDRLAGDLGEITPKVGSIAAVFDEHEQLLAIERSDGTGWCLPGGKVNVGESTADAAVREVREETRAVVEPLELVDTYPVEPPRKWPHHSIVHLYLCRRTGGELTTTRESDCTVYRDPAAVDDWALDLYPTLVEDARSAHRNR